MKYLIWSIENQGWLLESTCGYAFTRDRAGRFTLNEAQELVREANYYLKNDKIPYKLLVPDDFEDSV